MENQHLDELIEKYILKTATVEEQQELLDWYNGHNDSDVMWSSDQLNEEVLVKRRLLLNINERIQPRVKTVKLWPRFRIKSGMTGLIAVAAIAAVTLGTWIYMMSPDVKSGDEVVMNDIAPGKNGATITLANGRVIQLSDAKSGVVIGNGRIAYSSLRAGEAAKQSPLHDEIASIPRNDGQGGDVMQMTASTAKGQTYQFTLPDGTKVWLNADSKLEFPSNFVNSKTRNVKLSGEGYFEVAKDKAHPFIVETRRQKIEVLGTHFNVTAYASDLEVKTTLLEGKVAVTEGGSRLTLDPGDQAYSGADGIRAKTLSDPEAEVAWKNEEFVFSDNENIVSIMRRVERWYDVEVSYKGDMKDVDFTGSISRNKNISAILKLMERTGQVKFKIEGRKIIAEKGK